MIIPRGRAQARVASPEKLGTCRLRPADTCPASRLMLNHVTAFANAHMLDWAARMLAAAMLVAGLTGEALRYLNAESPAGVHTSDEKPLCGTLLTALSMQLIHPNTTSYCMKFALSKKNAFVLSMQSWSAAPGSLSSLNILVHTLLWLYATRTRSI